MTKVTLHESYVLVQTDDINFTDLRAAVALYNDLIAETKQTSLIQSKLSDTTQDN